MGPLGFLIFSPEMYHEDSPIVKFIDSMTYLILIESFTNVLPVFVATLTAISGIFSPSERRRETICFKMTHLSK